MITANVEGEIGVLKVTLQSLVTDKRYYGVNDDIMKTKFVS
jgi:hypothetical protein